MGRRGPSGPHVAVRPTDSAVEELLAEVVEQTQPHKAGSPEDLRGACAIVTGGATGIGRAIVLELARHGVHIAFNYLDDGDGRIEEEAERTSAELRQLEVKVLCRSCDVRDRHLVESFVQEAHNTLATYIF
jgi:FlaA1/EpsC-like NDP-sugar epimerase